MHVNRPDLAHAVGAGHGLVLDGRLDLRLADDDDGRGLQVEADTTCLNLRQQDSRALGTGKVVNDLLSPSRWNAACKWPEYRSTGSALLGHRLPDDAQHVLEVGEDHCLLAALASFLDDLDQPVQLRRLLRTHIGGPTHRHEVPGTYGFPIRLLV